MGEPDLRGEPTDTGLKDQPRSKFCKRFGAQRQEYKDAGAS